MRTRTPLIRTLTRTLAMALTGAAIGGPTPLTAQPTTDASVRWVDSLSRQIDRAVARGEVPALSASAVLADKLLQAFPGHGLLLHYRGYVAYRLSQLLPEQGDPAGATQQAAQAVTWLQRSVEAQPLAESYAMLASLYGKAIGEGVLDGMTGSQEIAKAEAAASNLGASNPRVLLLRGISTWFTPEQYGGGHNEGKALVRAAIAAFAGDHPPAGRPAWGHAEAYTWLGLMESEQGNRAAAREALQRALAIDPTYAWARTLLEGVRE